MSPTSAGMARQLIAARCRCGRIKDAEAQHSKMRGRLNKGKRCEAELSKSLLQRGKTLYVLKWLYMQRPQYDRSENDTVRLHASVDKRMRRQINNEQLIPATPNWTPIYTSS